MQRPKRVRDQSLRLAPRFWLRIQRVGEEGNDAAWRTTTHGGAACVQNSRAMTARNRAASPPWATATSCRSRTSSGSSPWAWRSSGPSYSPIAWAAWEPSYHRLQSESCSARVPLGFVSIAHACSQTGLGVGGPVPGAAAGRDGVPPVSQHLLRNQAPGLQLRAAECHTPVSVCA